MHIYEDEQTKYIDIGPVNKVIFLKNLVKKLNLLQTMNMLCVWDHEGQSEAFWKHYDRLNDYLWLSSTIIFFFVHRLIYSLDDGMKMQGYNGSQLWDTAFWAQAVTESGLGGQFVSSLKKLNHYLDISQVCCVKFTGDTKLTCLRYLLIPPICTSISDTIPKVPGHFLL